MLRKYSKALTFILTFVIIFTSISLENVAYAATPQISGIKLESIDGSGLRYKIWGLYFESDVKFIIGSREIDSSMYTKDQGEYIIERNTNNDSWEIWELPYDVTSKTMKVKAINPDNTESTEVDFTMEKVPYINSISAMKVYIDDTLTIDGSGFTGVDVVYVAGAPYLVDGLDDGDPDTGDFDIISDGKIIINQIVAPNQSAAQSNDVKVIKTTADTPKREIIGIYQNSIKVVTKVEDIDVEKIVPNTGPIEGGTEVKIYDKDKITSKIKPDMKIYIVEKGTNNIEAKNTLTGIEVIEDKDGNTIGILGITPPSPTGSQGVFDIIITDSTGNNEQVLADAFTYEEKKNLLSLSKVEPNAAKATETVEISGANIVNLNIDGLEDVDLLGYKDNDADNVDEEPLEKAPKFENGKYILNYTGELNGTPVEIKREITAIIGKVSKITDIVLKTSALDIIEAEITETNDYGLVTVTINTSTTITDITVPVDPLVIDVREEEAELVDKFTILPSNTIPVIESIEPAKGDVNKKIFITIKGDNFQVLADVDQKPIFPTIEVGTKTAEVLGVYDDDNNVVNGIGREIGTVIKAVIPESIGSTEPGPVHVKIINPDYGEAIVYDIFEFEKPSRDSNKNPKITKIEPNIGPLVGGNTITIEGENFDYQLPVPDVIVTIDGQIAKVKSASSSRIEVEVPAGLSIGEKPVQIITEDGAMDTIDPEDDKEERYGYTYVRVLSDPEVERIAPNFGGKGTIVYIFGKDKGIDNPNFFTPVIDPSARAEEMAGTRVLLNGIDINDIDVDKDTYNDGSLYERDSSGRLKDINLDGNIYDIPPTDAGAPEAFELEIEDVNGVKSKILSRVEVVDRNTLRVLIPDGYTAGLKDVTVLNPDSSFITIVDGFKYKIPPLSADVEIKSISPNLGSNLGGDYITIIGEDFKDGAEVLFGGYPSEKVDVISETKMLVKTPPYPLPDPDVNGNYKDVEVVVVNFDGSSASLPDGYRYQVPISNPEIHSIEPNSGTTLGNEEVTINGGDFREITKAENGLELENLIRPTVYFGGKEAEIIKFNYNKIVVKTPFYGKEGLVDVTVKNPQQEFGMITKPNAFEYRTSNPNIISVFPERAQKIGGDEITVTGKEILPGDFSSEIQMIPQDSEYEPNIDILAIFGDEKDEEEVSLDGAQTVLGDIIIEYKADRADEPFVIDADNEITDSLMIFYEKKNKDNILAHYDLKSEERRIFVIDWKALGEEEIAEEAVVVELIDDTLIARRRVAPMAHITNKNDDDPKKTVEIQTPPSAVIGQKNLYIENKDRGWDKTSFEYINPSSRPVIKEIIPRSDIRESGGDLLKYHVESTIEGGLYITIDGYDFRQDVEVFIDGVSAPLVSRNVLNEEDSEGRLRTRIVVTSPKGDVDKLNKELKIMIINPDGGFVDASDTSKIIPESTDAEAKPYYFVYRIPESSPYIDSILPIVTSQYGGNEIRIVGYDFRSGLTVVIGGQQCPKPLSIDNDEIVVKTPTDLTPGLKDVQVINTDHGTVTKTSAISVISYPEITTVTTEGGDAVERVSIEGGQKIVLSGRRFQSGASVYFGGERKQIGHSDNSNIKGLFKDDHYYGIEDAYAAKEVEFVSENQLIVTVPEVFKEGKYTITVLNTDTGLSDQNNVLDYRVPIPTNPIGLVAEIVNEKYIRIYGYSSSNASYYEVYACIDEDDPNDDDFKYLDTTEKTSYKITKFKELDDDENIYLRIRAVNKYGPSEWSNIAKISYRELEDIDGIGNEDTDGDLVSDYQESIGSGGVNVVLGNKDLKGSEYYIYVIDLKDKKYDKIDKRIINIPGKTIKNSNKAILMDNGDTKIQFNVRNFYVYSFINLGSKDQENTYGRIVFNRAKGKDSDYMQRKIPRKYRLISRVYDIKTEFQMEQKTTNLDSIAGYMDLEISYDENKLMGLKESKLQLYKFDPKEGKWIPLAGGVNPNTNKVHARIDGPGHYAILGEK